MDDLYDNERMECLNNRGDTRITTNNLKIFKNVPHIRCDLRRGNINGHLEVRL